ncbi:hypothetical protein NIES2101_24445 [Calothrix sp. HK-06]|nr:hypothetical protein NIES2101_24445 [Calothrix sp. HK-06]
MQLLNKGIQQAQEIQDLRAQLYALGQLGQVYEFAKQWPTAQQHTESALNIQLPAPIVSPVIISNHFSYFSS